MANLSELSTVIVDMFGVIGTIITEMVNLLTGDLLVLAIVGAFIGFILVVIGLLVNYLRGVFQKSISMKK